jgi:Fe-S-cluster containining protein
MTEGGTTIETSPGPRTYTASLAADVQSILDEIEARTVAYAASSGIKCRTGCGQCCLKPGVEVRPLELLPLARDLFRRGVAEAAYDAASAAADGVCVFYGGDKADPTLGRCGEYALRPSLCRLFGFAAVSRKSGAPELAACHWHKRLQPETVRAAQAAIDGGGGVPLFSEYAVRLSMLAPGTGLEHVQPINRALCVALAKVATEATLAQP